MPRISALAKHGIPALNPIAKVAHLVSFRSDIVVAMIPTIVPPEEVRAQFRIAPGVYLLGSMEKGVTVYSQQVRAINLTLAMADDLGTNCDRSIAIVGGGIGGMTAAVCALSVLPKCKVMLFERATDLCPLQQGSDSRWLHPHIYEWPDIGSRAPDTQLPYLNWREGRASDVADHLLREFERVCDPSDVGNRLSVILGVKHIRVAAASRSITWIGNRGERAGRYFRSSRAEGAKDTFESVVVAAGFGLERSPEKFVTPSYWRNDQLGQPMLTEGVRVFIVSGIGDGALIDLFRLTIERFRQDRIVDDLFGDQLKMVEERLRQVKARALGGEDLRAIFDEELAELIGPAVNRLRDRLRKDTSVILHLSGSDESNTSIEPLFKGKSSFLNKLLAFLLYRCGAFAPSFKKLELLARAHPSAQVICRYGPDSESHLKELFLDWTVVSAAVARLGSEQPQLNRPLWKRTK